MSPREWSGQVQPEASPSWLGRKVSVNQGCGMETAGFTSVYLKTRGCQGWEDEERWTEKHR